MFRNKSVRYILQVERQTGTKYIINGTGHAYKEITIDRDLTPGTYPIHKWQNNREEHIANWTQDTTGHQIVPV